MALWPARPTAVFVRREKQLIGTEPDQTAYVATAEDIILAKLEWYRLGGEVSERQWRDILGILEVRDDRLDWDYLRHSSAALNVADLLERARKERSTKKPGNDN